MPAQDPRVRSFAPASSQAGSQTGGQPRNRIASGARVDPAPRPAAGAAALAAGWLAAEAAVGGGLWAAGIAFTPAEAALMALAVTTPLGVAAAFRMLAARIARAEEAALISPSSGGDEARLLRETVGAVRGALQEERVQIEETLAGLSARLDAATAERARIAARLDAMSGDIPAPRAHRGFSEESAAPLRPVPAATPADRPEAPAAASARPPSPALASGRIVPSQATLDLGAAEDPGDEPDLIDTEDESFEAEAADGTVTGTSAQESPSDGEWRTLVRALDFPRDADDSEGFAALSEAVQDPLVADLLQAAEDTLTLLAQHNIYMEDLAVAPAGAADWAAYARGDRGAGSAPVAGVRDAGAIDTVRALAAHDAIFRDTAQHLTRRYDALLRKAVGVEGGEDRLPALADTRTGRAFMLVACARGAFE